MTGYANINGLTDNISFINEFSQIGDSLNTFVFGDTNLPNPRKFIYAGYSDYYLSHGLYYMPNGDVNVGIMN